MMRFTIDRIDHIVINVKSVEIAAAWYQRVLGMEREDFGPQNRTALKFGGQKVNLRPFDADEGTWATGVNTDSGAADVCFITAVPPDEVIGHLHHCGVQILQGPVERAGALGPILSVYCRDPDGNLIEISSYQSH
jgi:catechol 2,3-dioxygenase-like lactoylglutathione lyase family enzyme